LLWHRDSANLLSIVVMESSQKSGSCE
jgi:hypothetical protein